MALMTNIGECFSGVLKVSFPRHSGPEKEKNASAAAVASGNGFGVVFRTGKEGKIFSRRGVREVRDSALKNALQFRRRLGLDDVIKRGSSLRASKLLCLAPIRRPMEVKFHGVPPSGFDLAKVLIAAVRQDQVFALVPLDGSAETVFVRENRRSRTAAIESASRPLS
jgi:hypothetical protein